jgi:LacI family transcriptional regulator, galactose operon repressor
VIPLRRSTIKDVAANAGVAISTVSLVMNGKGYVSQATRTKVLAAAKELRYMPSQAARSLPSRRTGNIGFVVREDHFRRTEPFYTNVFLGTEFESNKHAYYVLLTVVPNGYRPEDHTPRFLAERNVDGLLIAGKVHPIFLRQAQEMDLPTVLIDFESDGLPAVVVDNQGGARAAGRHLIERGHRDIAFVGADMTHPSLKARREGFLLSLAEAGLSFDHGRSVVAVEGEPDYKTGMNLCQQLVGGGRAPTAVFCANDALALGVLDKAMSLGLKVPEQLAIVGFDDVPTAARNRPALTTVRVHTEQLGELAMGHLVDLLRDGQSPNGRVARIAHTSRIPTELVVRETT